MMNTGAAQYRAQQTGDAAAIVARHSELVRRIAHHLAARLPSSVEIDDLIQAGMLGLIEAAKNFQADQGAAFETYASIRIRGAMIDEIRRGDWVPRSVHRRYRDVVSATRQVEQANGRAANSAEIAATLGVSLEDYHHMLEDASRGQLLSLDEQMDDFDGEPRLAASCNVTPARELEHRRAQLLLVENSLLFADPRRVALVAIERRGAPRPAELRLHRRHRRRIVLARRGAVRAHV